MTGSDVEVAKLKFYYGIEVFFSSSGGDVYLWLVEFSKHHLLKTPPNN